MRNPNILTFFCVLVLQCFLLVGCGDEETGYYTASNAPSEVVQAATQQSSQQDSATQQPDEETLFMEAAGIEILTPEEEEERKSTRENEITLGLVGTPLSVLKSISAFNGAQDDYWVEVQKYDTREALLLDVVRKKGADIFVMDHSDLMTMVEKGVIEDLTSYFESSEVVKKENIVESIWRAGSVGEGMYYVIPRFEPKIMLVEKGYTDNGVWSMEDYLALAEKYPEGKLNEYVNTEYNKYSMFIIDLGMVLEDYVDWETRTCSFDSEKFVTILEKLKYNADKVYVDEYKNLVEQMYYKELLTKKISLEWGYHMTTYRDLRDDMLEFCEIAGMPNEDGQLKYSMEYSEIYGINADSEKKEIAWAFLEFLLSEEYQDALMDYFNGGDGEFPVRRDVLENSLVEEIGWKPDIPDVYRNVFTGERVVLDSDFTEEDVQVILDIVENCYCEYAIMGGINKILSEEITYFFEGGKSAKEVAEVIQSRVSLYLME